MGVVNVGVTVNPEFVQWEGEDPVLENVAGRLKASVVATVPAVMERSDDESGGREPPLDAGLGKDRLLDRDLWGRHWLHVQSAPSFAPRREKYKGLAFQPPEPSSLTDREGPKVASFLSALKKAGIETHVQIMAAAPPCYRVQSTGSIPDAQPLTADGRIIGGRVDANLSLAHPELRAYLAALIHDLVDEYPNMDALRFDWPEYPPYNPDSLLFDFNPHAIRLGERLGIDAESLRARITALGPDLVSRLRPAGDMIAAGARLDNPESLRHHLPVIAELIDYRRAIVTDYGRFLTRTVREASNGRVKCCLQCFPPPLNVLSGFSIPDLDAHADAIAVKFYTMHWPMIERAYVERMTELAGGNADDHLKTVRTALEIGPPGEEPFANVAYPKPQESHPATDDLIEAKLRRTSSQFDQAEMWGITHAYGPTGDVLRRFRTIARATGGRVHINRYGYLSNEKIAALERLVDEPAHDS